MDQTERFKGFCHRYSLSIDSGRSINLGRFASYLFGPYWPEFGYKIYKHESGEVLIRPERKKDYDNFVSVLSKNGRYVNTNSGMEMHVSPFYINEHFQENPTGVLHENNFTKEFLDSLLNRD